jgi:hypothetical protein
MSSPNLMTHQGASPEDAQLAGRSRPIATVMAAMAINSPKMAFTTKISPYLRPARFLQGINTAGLPRIALQSFPLTP